MGDDNIDDDAVLDSCRRAIYSIPSLLQIHAPIRPFVDALEKKKGVVSELKPWALQE